DHPETAGAPPVAAGVTPDFDSPARNKNPNMDKALDALKNAFDELAQSPGGEMGGFRAKTNEDIATTAAHVIAGVRAASIAAKTPAKTSSIPTPPTIDPAAGVRP
ncbi:MAG TPA: hypothetical protein VGN88_07025, partial [Phycisphaerae bacterium]